MPQINPAAPEDDTSDVSAVFTPVAEGLQVHVGTQVIGVILSPARAGGDYWCRISSSKILYKGLTLEDAKLLMQNAARSLQDRRVRAKLDAQDASRTRSSPKTVRLPTPKEDALAIGHRPGWAINRGASIAHPSRKSRSKSAPKIPAVHAPLAPCEICGVPVRNVRKHNRKCHPDVIDSVRFQPSGTGEARREGVVTGREQTEAALAKRQLSASMLVVRRTTGGKEVICPLCRAQVAGARFWEHASRAHRDISLERWTVEEVANAVRGSTATPKTTRQVQKPTPTAVSRKRKGKKKRGGPGKDARVAEDTRGIDVTRLYSDRYRDRGRFGSHPSHDGFGDDDHA